MQLFTGITDGHSGHSGHRWSQMVTGGHSWSQNRRGLGAPADTTPGFATLLRDELRPDILYSYNGDCFDAPYVELRARALTTDPKWTAYDQRDAQRQSLLAWGRSPLD